MPAARSFGLRAAPAVVVLVVLASACGSASSASPQGSSSVGDPTVDKLAEILAHGTLVPATDPAYPPQSYQVSRAKRLAHTKCTPNQMTGNQMAGYDAGTSKLVARALHVEPCFVAPTWSDMISGDWGTLDAPGQTVKFEAKNGTFVGYDLERHGLKDVALGKLDAFLCGVAVGAKAIAEGVPLRAVGGDQYVGYLSGAVDRSSGFHSAAFVNRVNQIVDQLQVRGTLRRLSLHYFHHDFATKARGFNTASLDQHVH